MNIKQIKRALSTFRNADVSIIKDDATRAKAQKLQAKQKGFTLLELLVVITLLATLATAALVAYDDVGENARDASAARDITTMESVLRNYRAIEGEYPEQFDNLANADGLATGGAMTLLAGETKAFFGQLAVPAATADGATGIFADIANSLANAGLEELQTVVGATTWNAGFVPNLAMNESYGEVKTGVQAGTEIEFDGGAAKYDDGTIAAATFTNFALSIVPSGSSAGACKVIADDDISATFAAPATVITDSKALNLINDSIGSDQCNLVIAVGIGKEVPGATAGKEVTIGQVATVGTNKINPKTNYARAIALFHVAQDTDGDFTFTTAGEIFPKARLLAVVGPEGRTIDQIVADATKKSDD